MKRFSWNLVLTKEHIFWILVVVQICIDWLIGEPFSVACVRPMSVLCPTAWYDCKTTCPRQGLSQNPMNLFVNSRTWPGTILQFDPEELVFSWSSWSVFPSSQKGKQECAELFLIQFLSSRVQVQSETTVWRVLGRGTCSFFRFSEHVKCRPVVWRVFYSKTQQIEDQEETKTCSRATGKGTR